MPSLALGRRAPPGRQLLPMTELAALLGEVPVRVIRWLVYRVRRPQPERATSYHDNWAAYHAAYAQELARIGDRMRRHWP